MRSHLKVVRPATTDRPHPVPQQHVYWHPGDVIAACLVSFVAGGLFFGLVVAVTR